MDTNYHKCELTVIRREAPDCKGFFYLGAVANGKFIVEHVGYAYVSIKERLIRHERRHLHSHFLAQPEEQRRRPRYLIKNAVAASTKKIDLRNKSITDTSYSSLEVEEMTNTIMISDIYEN